MTPGETAPEFALEDQGGRVVRLSELLGRGPVVVYFYPRAGTPGCTWEACAFRDARDEFAAAGAEVVGISGDSVGALEQFARERELPYRVLSDAGGAVRAKWGVPRDFGVLPGRVTYVLDSTGVVRRVIRSAVSMRKHVREASAAVRALASEKA